MQRNLIAKLLKTNSKDNALVAFYEKDNPDWRFSFVNREYELTEKGVSEKLSPAKRYSFLVGPNEPNHTCREQFVSRIIQENITVEEIKEAFNIENVTKEFFKEYRQLFIKLDKSLKTLVKKDELIAKEFEEKNIQTEDFAKKIMGQIVFLYFIQKKGWLGVDKDDDFGTGPKNFMRRLYNKEYINYENFFNEVLEPLFYKGLSEDVTDYHYELFNCKVPFLNGGLFENINGYNWEDTDILIDNKIFEEILDTFDTYNFTIKEDEPLDKEVAVDPEMLGKVFEKLLSAEERGPTGSFYTPREVVSYMCQKSLIEYLTTNSNINHEDISTFIETGYLALDSILRNNNEINVYGQAYNNIELPQSIIDNADELNQLLENVKIVDPAVGSGAFPVGMMYEIVNSRYILNLLAGNPMDLYELKRNTIDNSLYGVDISYSATDITKLRFWLSLIVDEEIIEPLPNLDNKILCGNSLVEQYNGITIYDKEKLTKQSGQLSLDLKYNSRNKFNQLEKLKHKYFGEKSPNTKRKLKKQINDLKWEFIIASVKDNIASNEENFITELNNIKNKNSKPFFIWELEFTEVFQTENPGFDIVIGNPPYVSNKGISSEDMKVYNEIYGLRDDLYNYFFIKSVDLLKERGVLSFITSDTYLTLKSKKNLRELFLKNKIVELLKINNVFEDVKVSPAIITIIKENMFKKEYILTVKDALKSFEKPSIYTENVMVFREANNKVLFVPSKSNLEIYYKYNQKVKELYEEWYDKIENSKKINKNKKVLNNYRNSLEINNITLLGLLTDGGVGLQTGNNGTFVAILDNTKQADNCRKNRPSKFLKAIDKYDIKIFENIKSKSQAQKYLNNLSESEIANLFDRLKEKYDRDMFGQGFIYKIIDENQIKDLYSLTDDEKINGITSEPSYVLYDKGDKDGNKWFNKSPYYLYWSKENVKFLRGFSIIP